MAGCAAIPPISTKNVVLDETASHQVADECQDTGPGAAALTFEERVRLERVLGAVTLWIPRSSIPEIRLRVCPDDASTHASIQGRSIQIPAPLVVWAFRELDRDNGTRTDRGDAVVGFVIAHEIGHLTAPACSGACIDGLECEREADAAATRLGYDVWPSVLLRLLAKKESSTPVARSDRCSRPDGFSAVERCVASLEMAERYASLLVTAAAKPDAGSSWDQRGDKVSNLETARKVRTQWLPEDIKKCRALAEEQLKIQTEESVRHLACMFERIEAVDQRMEHERVEVLQQADPRLRSREVAWSDDAWLLLDAGASPSVGSFAGVSGAQWGGILHASALWEGGGAKNAFGLRFGWGRYGSSLGDTFGAGQPTSRYSLQLVARGWWPIVDWFALVLEGGGGATHDQLAIAGTSRTSLLVSLDGRMSLAPFRRVHLSVGVGFSYIPVSPSSYLLYFPVALEFHLGDYAAFSAK